MTTANEYKAYRDLLEALAHYHAEERDRNLDAFLTGYAGWEWDSAKARVAPRAVELIESKK